MISSRARERLLTAGIISAAAIFVCLWSVPPERFIAGGDGILPELSPHVWLSRFETLWGYYAGTGKDIAFGNGWFPIVSTDELLSKLGASSLFLNHFWLVAVFVLQALGVCFLYRTVFPEHGPVLSSVFAGLASVLNPFVLITFHSPYLPSALSIALFPWLLGSFLRYATGGAPPLLLLFTFVSLFDVVADVNVAYILLQFAIMLALLAFTLAKSDTSTMRRRSIAMLVIFTCAHVPLIWGIAGNVRVQMAEIGRSMHGYSVGTYDTVAQTSSLWNVARLVGTVLFFRDVGGKPFLIGNKAYTDNLAVVVSTVMLPLLAILAVCIRRKRGVTIALVTGAVVAIIGANGGAPPFGSVFLWALAYIPGFATFRDPFSKFGWIVVIAYALAAGWLIDHALHVRRLFGVSLLALGLAGLALSAFPIFAKHLFWEQLKVAIPPAYRTVASTLNADGGEGRILQSPVSPTLFETYSWGYVGSGILLNLVSRSMANHAGAFESSATEHLLSLLQYDGTDIGVVEAPRALAFLGFTDVVDDASFNGGFFEPTQVAHIGPQQTRSFMPQRRVGSLATFSIRAAATNLVYSPLYAVRGVTSFDDIGFACRLIGCTRTIFFQNPVAGITAASFDAVDVPHATHSWFAKHARDMLAYRANERTDALSIDTTAVRQAVAESARRYHATPVARPWSAPIENPWFGGKSSIVADRLPHGIHISRLEARAETYARIDNLGPDTRYDLTFTISDSVDRAALLLVVDQHLKQISAAQVGDVVAGGVVRMSFRNPGANRTSFLYLYLPKIGPQPINLEVFNPLIQREGLGEEVVAIPRPVRLAAPRFLRYSRRADGYDVEVKRAPAAYLVAFNVSENPNWQLIVPAGISARRLPANLYEQAWLVRGAGTYSLRITYRPDTQRPFILVASLMTLLAALMLALANRPREATRSPGMRRPNGSRSADNAQRLSVS